MKKTIHKNYSLLVLILLILLITFLNLPEDKINIQRGGGDDENPWSEMDDDKLSNKLAKFSSIYGFLKNYFWVYCGIVGVLLLVAGYYAYNQYSVQGIPAIGYEGGITWDGEGMQFLNFFYIMSREKFGLNPPKTGPMTNPKLLDSFEDDYDKFISTKDGSARAAVDTFCNVIAPCNTCNCSGPDPNYAGDPVNTPMVRFKGKDPHFGNCVPKNETKAPSPADAAANIVKMQKKRGVQDLSFGRIPNCCCQLWKTVLGDKSNFTPAKLEAFLNKLPDKIGLSPTTGCEPSQPQKPAKLSGSDGSTVEPHVVDGKNQYIHNMVLSCAMKVGLPDVTKDTYQFGTKNIKIKTLSSGFTACSDYDLALDEGVSAAHVAKNASRYLTPSIGNTPKATSPGDVTPDWTSGIWTQTSGSAPKMKITKPTDWPSVAPFDQKGIINNYWYTSSSKITYQLTVNNALYEVAAYPVKIIDVSVYDTEIKDTTAKAYLDKYLSTAALAANKDIHIFGGSYYIP